MSAALEEMEKEAASVANRMVFAPAERDVCSRRASQKDPRSFGSETGLTPHGEGLKEVW
jgi:hypothetical protein